MTCWLKKQILAIAWIMILQVVLSENGESRLRRSLDACALDFIVSIRRCCFFCFILLSGFLPKLIVHILMQDIPRTFPGHPALDENGRNSLRRLLLAYARHNPSVGYCQVIRDIRHFVINLFQ